MRIAILVLLIAATSCGHHRRHRHVTPCNNSDCDFTYRCESGEAIEAAYPTTSTAIVEYKGETYRMEVARSASGARYIGDGLVWWTKGTGSGAEGSLFRAEGDDETGELVEQCEEVSGPR